MWTLCPAFLQVHTLHLQDACKCRLTHRGRAVSQRLQGDRGTLGAWVRCSGRLEGETGCMRNNGVGLLMVGSKQHLKRWRIYSPRCSVYVKTLRAWLTKGLQMQTDDDGVYYVGSDGFVCMCNLRRPVTICKPTALAMDLRMPLIFAHLILNITSFTLPTLNDKCFRPFWKLLKISQTVGWLLSQGEIPAPKNKSTWWLWVGSLQVGAAALSNNYVPCFAFFLKTLVISQQLWNVEERQQQKPEMPQCMKSLQRRLIASENANLFTLD